MTLSELEEVEASDSDAVSDPLSPEEAPGISLIVQMRIYDVLMALLKETNEAAHVDLLEAHAQGLLVASAPDFIGRFLTNEQNP